MAKRGRPRTLLEPTERIAVSLGADHAQALKAYVVAYELKNPGDGVRRLIEEHLLGQTLVSPNEVRKQRLEELELSVADLAATIAGVQGEIAALKQASEV